MKLKLEIRKLYLEKEVETGGGGGGRERELQEKLKFVNSFVGGNANGGGFTRKCTDVNLHVCVATATTRTFHFISFSLYPLLALLQQPDRQEAGDRFGVPWLWHRTGTETRAIKLVNTFQLGRLEQGSLNRVGYEQIEVPARCRPS